MEGALRVILYQRRALPGEAAVGGGRQAQRGALQLGVVIGSHKRVVGQRYRVQLQAQALMTSFVTGDCNRKVSPHLSQSPELMMCLRRNGEPFSCDLSHGTTSVVLRSAIAISLCDPGPPSNTLQAAAAVLPCPRYSDSAHDGLHRPENVAQSPGEA